MEAGLAPPEEDGSWTLELPLTTFLRNEYFPRVASQFTAASPEMRRKVCQEYLLVFNVKAPKGRSPMESLKAFAKFISIAGTGLQVSDRDLGEAFHTALPPTI
uniref:Uncharacterized protein n=1 Tax=Chromera velia CCMP2878 TaxID=1169474 RepID=A0A0G4GVW0_9ALVE|eukprot:Cvel_23612.t1-p1 / transcript=Cvel_23612.t1 / gene=Cvel_23612 / organism=Chromera_velia_CCMP2878 / gene_product=hypothetical protein / transcript_product=hypothetical protein / location=Cvel_scaffold2452:13169-13474(+) / protein_length=102 / sequence_SO=supercontig / SO=protein_coding / is_pseudo=false